MTRGGLLVRHLTFSAGPFGCPGTRRWPAQSAIKSTASSVVGPIRTSSPMTRASSSASRPFTSNKTGPVATFLVVSHIPCSDGESMSIGKLYYYAKQVAARVSYTQNVVNGIRSLRFGAINQWVAKTCLLEFLRDNSAPSNVVNPIVGPTSKRASEENLLIPSLALQASIHGVLDKTAASSDDC